jgi:hypothetical protein
MDIITKMGGKLLSEGKHGSEYLINGHYIYTIPAKSLNIVVSPDDKILITDEMNSSIYHSTALRKFPKRKNKGEREIHFGYKVIFETENDIGEFIKSFIK